MLSKITKEELDIFETLYHPKSCTEILFHDFDSLGSFSEEKYGKVRDYQIPFQSFASMYCEDKQLSKKENFNIKKGLAEVFGLGGRVTGKTLIILKIDVLLALLHKLFNWGAVSSCDAMHIRGVLEPIIIALINHPILKLLKAKILRSPAYQISTINKCLLESVNNNLAAKNPGGNWFGKHIDMNWEEEASFLTDTITNKKLMAESELGCVYRLGGMTTFAKNSPMGRIFNDLQNENKIINLPSYVNKSYWNDKREEDAIREFNGKNSQAYQVQVLGKIVEHGAAVFDMERLRVCYKRTRKGEPIPIKSFEINKDNFFKYKEEIIIDRPKNVENCIVALDKGEGAAPTEIIIIFQINGKYKYTYNITNFKLKPDEDEVIINYIIEKIKANIVGIDITSGTGKTLFSALSKKYPKNIVGVSFNEKIPIDFELDEKQNIKYTNKGKPIYKYEYIVDWSIQQLKDLFYNKKIEALMDFKLDKQFNGIIAMQSGMRTIYKPTTENHLFQAFQVFAIVHWMTEFKSIQPIRKNKPGLGAFSSA